MTKAQWQKIESGWYYLPDVAAISQDTDGRWHVYDGKDFHATKPLTPDGFPTLRIAKQFVAARELEATK